VTFGTLPPTWARRVVTLVLTLFPFLYLAVLWKVIHRMYNPRYSSLLKSMEVRRLAPHVEKHVPTPMQSQLFHHSLTSAAPFRACVGCVCSDSVGKQHVRKGPGRGARRVTFADVAGIDAAKLELSTSDLLYTCIFSWIF
jgi:hypothetical protein